MRSPGPSDRKSARNGASRVRASTRGVGTRGLGALAMANVAGAAGSYDDEPMSRVLGLDEATTGTGPWIGYILGAIALFLGLVVSARVVAVVLASWNPAPAAPGLPPQEIDVMAEPPPPQPPPPPEAEKVPEPEPAPPAAVRAAPHEAPAPAPAQAGKVLTAEPDPNEPVDLTGNTIVTGNADVYAGGTTASNGTGTRAVRSVAVAQGAPTGTGTVAAPAGPDRSRKASLAVTDWNAPFPPEADTAQIDEAYVGMQIECRADGTVAGVTVVSDPGNGFGREARKYALTVRCAPALDRDGNSLPSKITTRVHFSR